MRYSWRAKRWNHRPSASTPACWASPPPSLPNAPVPRIRFSLYFSPSAVRSSSVIAAESRIAGPMAAQPPPAPRTLAVVISSGEIEMTSPVGRPRRSWGTSSSRRSVTPNASDRPLNALCCCAAAQIPSIVSPDSRASSREGRTTDAKSDIDEHAGVQDPARVDRPLGAAERLRELIRSLAVVPGPVVTADGVVMGDGAAAVDHRLRDGRLDLVPLLDLAPAAGRAQDREVGSRAVGVDVGEATRQPRRPRTVGRGPAGVRDRPPGGLHHVGVEGLEAIPGDRGLERVAQHSA